MVTFVKFVGPGFMVSVAYIGPASYTAAVVAGHWHQFSMLFVVLLSNIFAMFLQTLAVKLGAVSGLNLAEACRAFLPRWLNLVLFFMVQVAIMATDFTEVITVAMILNLKFPNVPLTAGCALSMVPVLLIVFLYVPQEALGCLRMFGFLVMAFIVFIAVCFSTELALIKDTSAADVFRGYLPSAALVERRALYHACSIIGATLVPHALYVGSGIVQARLRNFDVQSGLLPADRAPSPAGNDRSRHPKTYQPSVAAIRHCFAYSVAELVVCLFLFTLFVSSAVLVVSAASLYGRDPFIQVDGGTGPTDRNVIEQPTSLIGIYRFLHICLSPFAGDIFRLALILSGMLAGIVCTMAGQMLSEGALRWRVRLWMRFVATRGFTILPSIVIVIAAAADEKWVVEALKWSSVVQGVVLPFVAAPLVYFTSVEKCEWCLSCFVCLA